MSKIHKISVKVFLSLFIFQMLFVLPLFAHPSHGIAIDSKGNIYISDIHRQTIWKISPNGKYKSIAKNKWSHQLFMDENENLYFSHEEGYQGQGGYSFWKMNPEGNIEEWIPPTSREIIPSDIFVVDNSGNTFIADKNAILKRSPQGTIIPINLNKKKPPNEFLGIDAMTVGPDGDIYLIDVSNVYRITSDGGVTIITENLLEENPANPPFRHSNPRTVNRLFGLTVDISGNIYVAYYGNRSVLKISPEGKKETVYQSEAPWSPVGVAVFNEELYIKEAGMKEGVGNFGPRIQKLSKQGEVIFICEI